MRSAQGLLVCILVGGYRTGKWKWKLFIWITSFVSWCSCALSGAAFSPYSAVKERAKNPGIAEEPQCCVPGFFTDFNICSCSGFYCQALHMISASQTFTMYYLVMTFSEWHLWCTIHSCFEFNVQWTDFRRSKEIWLARLHQAWIRFW